MSVFAPMSLGAPGQKEQLLSKLMGQYQQTALRAAGTPGRLPPVLGSPLQRGVAALSPQMPVSNQSSPLAPAIGSTLGRALLQNYSPFRRV